MRILSVFGLIAVFLLLAILPVFGAARSASQKEASMPIVLFTDFGSEDYRVSQLKGIMYSNNRESRLIDGSHDIPAFDIPTGAFIMDIAAKEFPQNTVFVGIVAPYAQPETRYFVLTSNNNQIFVLPDNGLVTHILKNTGIKTVYQITNQKLFDEPIEELSAERIQGKIGALVASGYRTKDVGIPLASPRILDIQVPAIVDNKLLGTVVYVDNFGNCVTNISRKTANEFGLKPGDTIQIRSGGSTVSASFGTIYSDVPEGKEIVFVNNNLDLVQLSVNLGNFSETHNTKAGARVEIEM
jgi:S-adenosylmethionine hydrolase